MLVSLTVGKVDAGVAVLLTEDKRLVGIPLRSMHQEISSLYHRLNSRPFYYRPTSPLAA